MIIQDLKELRNFSVRYGCTTRRADKTEDFGGMKVVQMLDCHGCVWRSGKGETAKEAWQDLCNKVFSANRPPRKPVAKLEGRRTGLDPQRSSPVVTLLTSR